MSNGLKCGKITVMWWSMSNPSRPTLTKRVKTSHRRNHRHEDRVRDQRRFFVSVAVQPPKWSARLAPICAQVHGTVTDKLPTLLVTPSAVA
jgi:hypothetical protein